MNFELTYKPFGETSILIEWPNRIDPAIIQDIASFEKVVSKQQKVIETIVAYNSLTVRYEFRYFYSNDYRHRKDYQKSVNELQEWYAMERASTLSQQKVWEIPVCYDLEFGFDLEEVAFANVLSKEEVIRLHSEPYYLIYFIGFQPGFLYLGGLSSKIKMPRRSNPRLRVGKGSVAIGGEQTGVYPQESSGGWNIIGKSPIDFFDISKSKPCFAKAGEYIQFTPVEHDEFNRITKEIEQGNYSLKFHWL